MEKKLKDCDLKDASHEKYKIYNSFSFTQIKFTVELVRCNPMF